MLSIDDNNELLYIKTEKLSASQSQNIVITERLSF